MAFLQKTVAQVLSPDKGESFAILKPLNLDPTQYHELKAEILSLVDKFSYRSENPKNQNKSECRNWQLAIAAGPATPDAEAPIINLKPSR